MKAHVDRRRCQSAALCVSVAPDVFDLGDDGVAVSLHDELPDDLVGDADEAVAACPAAALALSADKS
ncbi:ferredoxin [Gordonia sp. PKS22-38]|uniref:Ferredoxin n=1 Tax=Gordonia prachuapensis TaxID=3115651 RepID=A0ABU7MUI7_9ACTN|nr:ferredoxin [Gordonia sp. PKS22-38]